MTRIVVGTERRRRLQQFGFDPTLLDAFDAMDPTTSALVASNGEVLAEIAHLDWLAALLPGGDVVPVCHLSEDRVQYLLLVDGPEGPGLLELDQEFQASVPSIEAFLTERITWAWEGERLDGEALVAWCERVGFRGGVLLLEGLARR